MLISLYLFYQLNPQISILSPQPMPFQSCQLNPTVLQPWKCSHFAQKQKIREPRAIPQFSEIPLFQAIFNLYLSFLDINTTVSTWLECSLLMSASMGTYQSFFIVYMVLGNISTVLTFMGTYQLYKL